ncbi:MAG: hypothetical protein KBA79_08205 [Candidatus Cloacimonetes bacterium]|nr:hypothetical protein [Candidatus Cloacimonadota bacterium]
MKDELVEKTREQVTQDIKYRDGIPRIAAGVFMVIAMLLALAGNTSTFVIFIPIIPGLVEGLRKRYTYPRVGYAKVRDNVKPRALILAIGLALIVGVGVAAMFNGWFGFELPSRAKVYGPISIAVAIPVILIGFVIFSKREQRWSTTAILVLIIILIVFIFKPARHSLYYIVMAFGALNLIIGIFELRKFLRDYPVIPDE